MRLVSDIAYGDLVGAGDPTTEGSSQLANTWALFRSARSAQAILTNEGKRKPTGLIVLAVLLWVTRQRKLVLTEFLPGTRTGLKGAVVTAAYRFLLPRTVLAAQVMTAWELEDYADRYRIHRDRLRLIPFYYFDDRSETTPRPWSREGRSGLMSTGKNSCDWTTLITAARGEGWPLTIVCRRSDSHAIADTAAIAEVTVLADVPRADHDSMLATSEILIIALENRSMSAGHVRLMTAATWGTPVILTEVRGVAGYEQLAAALVRPGDVEHLRSTVNRLMADGEHLQERMSSVTDFARTRPYSTYVAELREFVARAVEQAA